MSVTVDVLRGWGAIVQGRRPALSVEITKECPLRCPGCYAYEDNHLGGEVQLVQLHDFKGDQLVRRVLALVDELRPLHLSIVGGDPLVRYRELDALLPLLVERKIFVQVVTSAFRPIPAAWATLPGTQMVVSIDGLQPDHDERRKPATYDRIVKNIAGHQVVVHCTITAQMLRRAGYLEEFVRLWSGNPNVRKIWMSIFTPQRNAELPEIPTPPQRAHIIDELLVLRDRYPKLDMPRGMVEAFRTPPQSPAECIFAMTTRTISADLTTIIAPCQFGGDPDCSRCGCIASMGLAAIGNHRLPLGLKVGSVFRASFGVGERFARLRAALGGA